jgi:hypothetical protein
MVSGEDEDRRQSQVAGPSYVKSLCGFSWEYTMKVMEVVHGSFLYFTTKIPLNPKERNIKIT